MVISGVSSAYTHLLYWHLLMCFFKKDKARYELSPDEN